MTVPPDKFTLASRSQELDLCPRADKGALKSSKRKLNAGVRIARRSTVTMVSMPETEWDVKNRAIVDRLLESFKAIVQQLTPDIEPATVYLLNDTEPAAEDQQ